MFKVNKNTRTVSGRPSEVFIFNFERLSQLFPALLLLALKSGEF